MDVKHHVYLLTYCLAGFAVTYWNAAAASPSQVPAPYLLSSSGGGHGTPRGGFILSPSDLPGVSSADLLTFLSYSTWNGTSSPLPRLSFLQPPRPLPLRKSFHWESVDWRRLQFQQLNSVQPPVALPLNEYQDHIYIYVTECIVYMFRAMTL